MTAPHLFSVTIYYEDTDITGLVYHPNYFKYFERARSDFFGGERLYRLQMDEGISVAVYRADIVFKKAAHLGDTLTIQTWPTLEGDYRLVFKQQALLASTQTVLTEANVELVCIANNRLTTVPDWVKTMVIAR